MLCPIEGTYARACHDITVHCPWVSSMGLTALSTNYSSNFFRMIFCQNMDGRASFEPKCITKYIFCSYRPWVLLWITPSFSWCRFYETQILWLRMYIFIWSNVPFSSRLRRRIFSMNFSWDSFLTLAAHSGSKLETAALNFNLWVCDKWFFGPTQSLSSTMFIASAFLLLISSIRRCLFLVKLSILVASLTVGLPLEVKLQRRELSYQ